MGPYNGRQAVLLRKLGDHLRSTSRMFVNEDYGSPTMRSAAESFCEKEN